MPTFRRLLAALAVAAACVLVGPTTGGAAAAPCTCDPSTVQDDVKGAAAVFVGTVEEITPAGSGNADNAFSRTSSVMVQRVYKPTDYRLVTTDTVEVVTTRAFGTCARGSEPPRDLAQGETYVFFVEAEEGLTASACGGTTRATTELITQVTRLLGDGRDPAPPETPAATLTPVSTDEPASLTRLAAPGLALILIGLLGLAVVRRLARPGR